MVSFLRILFGPLGDVSAAAVTWAVRNQLPILVAVFWRLAMLPSNSRMGVRFSRKKLLVLERQGGREDVENAYQAVPADYAILFLPRLILKASCHFFLGNQVSDLSYKSEDQNIEEAKIAYRNHLVKVLWWFKRLFGLSAILQFNIIYYAERELALACKELNVNFVCLQKEGNWSPLEYDFLGNFYKEAADFYQGEAIAYYSNTSRKLYEEAGATPRYRGYVVGCARVDSSHRLRMSGKTRAGGYVLYYLIEEFSGLTQMPESIRPSKGWSDMADLVNRTILRMAEEHPSVRFVVKAKSGHGERQVNSFTTSLFNQGLPPNLSVISGGSGHHLLQGASVVVGFNTTAVLEAVAAGVPTIVPHIFSTKEQEFSRGAHLVAEGVRTVTDSAGLEREILDALGTESRDHELDEGEKTILERMLGNPDGRSGLRLRSFLDSAVYDSFEHEN